MSNVPVGPNRGTPSEPVTNDTPKEPWRENIAASSRSAGNSFKAASHSEKKKRGLTKTKLIAAVVGLAVVVAAFFYLSSMFTNPGGLIDKSRYQAVFFTNGQVYFGKLSAVGDGYYKLTDIFYIQAKEAPAATDSENPQETGDSQQSAEPQLVKLGEEIHGPDDAMIINRDQVLFFENLKKDGKVTSAITQYEASKQ